MSFVNPLPCPCGGDGNGGHVLNCETDSVTVCPPEDDAPFHVIVDSSPPVSFAPLDCLTDSITVCQGTTPWVVGDVFKLVPEEFDFIDLTYTGENITNVVYKQGGSGGTTVATLDITYSGDKILTVTRT